MEKEIINCGNCICRKCEHWHRYRCPVASRRTEPDPAGVFGDYSWTHNICTNCNRALKEPNGAYAGRWQSYQEHRFSCEDFMPDSSRTEPCLGYSITVYASDGEKYCPLVDSIGCEACYQSFLSNLEDEGN